MLTTPKLVKEIFYCPEESSFYSYSIESLVLKHSSGSEVIHEFGSGDGGPVIDALLKPSKFDGIVHGYEINKSAVEIANLQIKEARLGGKYVVHNDSFFVAKKPDSRYLISNPPYLPAWDNNLYQPALHGGVDGNNLSKQLLSIGYENVMLMLSSYSHPVDAIEFALRKGYHVSSFLVSPMEFGHYSSEQKVMNRIAELRRNRSAFYSENIYLLAGVWFKKQQEFVPDLSNELIRTLTAL